MININTTLQKVESNSPHSLGVGGGTALSDLLPNNRVGKRRTGSLSVGKPGKQYFGQVFKIDFTVLSCGRHIPADTM